jgi:hypothetical protein
MLAVGLLFGLLTPASPQFQTSPTAAEEPNAADKAHMEWLMRAWSQTPDSEKANWAWFAGTWPQADPIDKTRSVWLAGKWANAGESEREHWAWLGSMWARARAAVQPGTTRGDVLKMFRLRGYGRGDPGSSQITEQYAMGRCPFIIVTVLEDARTKGPWHGESPDNSARIEKIVRQEFWPYVPLEPDAEDERHCQQLRRSSGTERAELSRRAEEWGDADNARREDLARLAGMSPDEKPHWDWLGQRWDEAKAISPGISEADLSVVFESDGGLQTIPAQRWVLRRCHYIKIDVHFEQNPQQLGLSYSPFGLPSYSLKTTKISEPRIEPMVTD